MMVLFGAKGNYDTNGSYDPRQRMKDKMDLLWSTYHIAGDFRRTKFSQIHSSKNENSRVNHSQMLSQYCDRRTRMPNSQALLSWMLGQPQNLQNFPTIMVLRTSTNSVQSE